MAMAETKIPKLPDHGPGPGLSLKIESVPDVDAVRDSMVMISLMVNHNDDTQESGVRTEPMSLSIDAKMAFDLGDKLKTEAVKSEGTAKLIADGF